MKSEKVKVKNGWKETTLGEVAEIVMGQSPKGESYNLCGDGLPFYQGITEFGDKYVEIKTYTNRPTKIIAENTILFSVRAPVGKVNVTKHKACIGRGNAGLLMKNGEQEFLYYLLKYNEKAIQGSTSGTVFESIGGSDLRNYTITIPAEKSEQKAIAAILSSFDDKIELLRRQNKTLEKIAQTIFKQSFMKNKRWDGNLSEYLKVQGGYAFKSKDFKQDGFAGIVKITNISMGTVDIHNTQFVGEDIVKDIDEDKFRINSGDFLIAMTGAEIGKIGVVEKTNKQIWLNQRVGKLVAKVPYGGIVGYLTLRTREGQQHIIDAASGSAQPNISSTGIEEMVFVPYSKKETNSFGEKVKSLFEKITFNLSQIQTLSKLRDALLPKLMKGKIKVKSF